MKVLNLLRWLLLLPVTIGTWYGVFFLGLVCYISLEKYLCTPSLHESFICENGFSGPLMQAIPHIFVALSAVAVVVVATLCAPDYKRHTASAAFFCGTIVAVLMGWNTQAWSLVAAAVAGGLFAVAAVGIRLRSA